MLTLTLTAVLGLSEVVRGDLGAKLDHHLTLLEAHGYSGAVLVADRDGIVLEKGYGLADRGRGVPVTPDTVFTCGSITKQFTAAAIMKLQEEGELSVDDALVDWFDDVPEDKRLITLHELLIHGSGLFSDFAGDFEEVDRDEYVRRTLASELLFDPGTGYNYSNSGYSLLAAVVEEATGRSYEEYVRTELFLPSGMEDTGYLLPGYADERLARGYTGAGEWGTLLERSMADDGPWWALRGNGGMHTTVGDMYRWHLALEGDELLSEESKEQLYAPHNPEGGGTDYGYGWSIEQTPDGLLITHNGGNGVFAADFLRFVDAGVTVYMTSNSAAHSAARLARPVARLALGQEVVPPPPILKLSDEELAAYAGSYGDPEAGALEIRSEPGALVLVGDQPRAFELAMGDQPPPGSRVHQLMKRSLAAMEAASQDDFGPMAEILDGDPERIAERGRATWAGLRADLGELSSIALLGARDTGFQYRVWLRLDFERGARFMMHGWEDDAVGGLLISEQPPTRRVVPTERGLFVEHDLRSGRSWRVRFELDGDAPTAAIFDTWKGDLSVPRLAD